MDSIFLIRSILHNANIIKQQYITYWNSIIYKASASELASVATFKTDQTTKVQNLQ